MQYSKEEQQQHLDNWKIQADKKLKNTAAPFIPTTVKVPSGMITVNTPSGLSISCQTHQLPQILQALQTC